MEQASDHRDAAARFRYVMTRVWRFIVKHKYPLVLLVINLIVFHKWFFNFSTLTYGDWFQHLNVTSREALSLPYMWESSNLALGGVPALPTSYPITAMEGLIARLGFGWPVIQRLLYLWPLVIVGALGSYYLVKRITKTELPAFVGSIVYTFNTYFLILRSSHILTMAAFAFAPLVIIYFQRAMEEKKYYLAVLTGLFSWIVGFYDMRVLYIAAWVLLLYFIYHTFVIEKPSVALVKKNALLALTPAAILLLTNLYWILGFFKSGGFGNQLYSRALFGNEYLNLLRAMTLFHPFWTGSKPSLFIIMPIPVYFYLIPVIAFLGLVLNRKNKEVWFFGGIAVIGIFLAKQVGGPLPGLYPWLFHNIPGFSLFREASKFYFLIVLGYSILIAMFVKWLWKNWSVGKWKYYGKYILTALIILIFIFNALPFVTGGFGTMLTPRKIPRDYLLFQDLILKQKDFFRTLWVPAYSRWGIYTANHPLISYTFMIGSFENFGDWKDIVDSIQHPYGWHFREQIKTLFNEPYFSSLLGNASVKYVVVPVRDTANDDDFFENSSDRDYFIDQFDRLDYLRKIDIGTKELAVYEYKGFRPYMDSEDTVFRLQTLSGLDEKYRFAVNVLKNRFAFVEGNDASSESLTMLHNLFEPSEQTEVSESGAAIRDKVNVDPGVRNNNAFKNMDRRTINYEAGGGRLQVTSFSGGSLFLNGELLNFPAGLSGEPVATTAMDPQRDYYLSVGGSMVPVVTGPPRAAGVLAPGQELSLLSSARGANLIHNGSFEQGLWNREVQDFHNYDKNPVLGMRIAEGRSEGTKSIQLEAARHIAATTQNDIPVNPGSSYLLSIDYQSPNGGNGEYEVSFNPGGTLTKETLTMSDTKWHTTSTLIRPPEGTTSLNLALLCSPKAEGQKSIVRYDNVKLEEMSVVASYKLGDGKGFDSVNAPLKPGKNNLEFRDSGYTFSNLIHNGSFEQGLWNREVQDFHNYDKRPVLAMRITEGEKGKGSKAVELEAARHIAATTQNGIPVNPGSSYLISIDYQSPNGGNGEYEVSFNPGGTQIKEALPTEGDKWHTYQTTFKVPEGTFSLNLALLCSPKAEGQRTIVRYDNVKLTEVPDFLDYCLVSEPGKDLKSPGKVEFESVNPTRKVVHVKSASKPFFLSMAESYHTCWRATVISKGKGSYLIPEREHLKLDEVSNAWFVNLPKLKDNGLARGNADGTYDLDLVIEFTPQRYTNIGFAISLIAFLGAIAYLVIDWRRRRRRAKYEG